MVVAGLAICSFTRSAANILLPAILLMWFLTPRVNFKKALIYFIAVLGTLFLVSWIQFAQTGEWLGFIKTQEHWGHRIQWPALPFSTWWGMILLDAAALLTGLYAVGFVLLMIYQRIRYRQECGMEPLLFSMLILAGLTGISLLYKGGVLFSLNRYIIPSAFFLIAGTHVLNFYSYGTKRLFKLIFGVFIFFILFHFFVHIQVVLRFFLLSVYVGAYLLLNHPVKQVSRIAFLGIYAVNCFLQVMLLDMFLNDQWVA